MKRREMLYSDYSMPHELVKELKAKCKRLTTEEQVTLLLCAIKANQGIAPALYYSLVSGASYDALSSCAWIPLSRVDFYGYQRYCLSLFNDAIEWQQIEMVYGPG